MLDSATLKHSTLLEMFSSYSLPKVVRDQTTRRTTPMHTKPEPSRVSLDPCKSLYRYEPRYLSTACTADSQPCLDPKSFPCEKD